MFEWRPARLVLLAPLLLCLMACQSRRREPGTVVFLIESSPANLDPRVGTDGMSEHIDELVFDGLVERDASFHFTPALAESWEQRDPVTLVFHLRPDVKFHDGRPLTSRDVAFSINSMRDGTVISPKAATYASIASIETPDLRTVIFHLKQPDNFLLTNLSTGALGIMPEGSGREFWRHPVGTGPFRFVSQQIDQNVVLERNPLSWSVMPQIARVRFAVVPDSITEALELEKGSGDVAINSLPMDALPVLAQRPDLRIDDGPGTQLQYLAFNLRDPILSNVRVRQAIACAIDRSLLIKSLLGRACPACGKPVAREPLGLGGQWPALRIRSGSGRAIARRSGLSSRARRGAASSHHENKFDRRRAPALRRPAAAIGPRGDRARLAQL